MLLIATSKTCAPIGHNPHFWKESQIFDDRILFALIFIQQVGVTSSKNLVFKTLMIEDFK